MIDLILMFFSSFKNKNGEEIWVPKEIAKNYVISRRFVVDLGSLFGTFVSIIMPESILTFFSILKVTRVLRIE